ncbi:MAG TPA: hypothetical protein VKQ30_20460 [Ktedonobacterales bacterium]|nr:hypothetical protein [Ktedonobacterales bacterium]
MAMRSMKDGKFAMANERRFDEGAVLGAEVTVQRPIALADRIARFLKRVEQENW